MSSEFLDRHNVVITILLEGGLVEAKLEVVPVPVSDVDRAKQFYVDQVGFELDIDDTISDEIRLIRVGNLTGHGAVGLALSRVAFGRIDGSIGPRLGGVAMSHERGSAAKSGAIWLLGSAVLGAIVGFVAEMLVGEGSGGGWPGATEQLLNVAIAAAIAGVVLAALLLRPSAVTPVAWTLVALAVISVALAWYAPMALVLGATAYGVAEDQVPGEPPARSRRAGVVGGAIALLWLVAFVVIVVAEIL